MPTGSQQQAALNKCYWNWITSTDWTKCVQNQPHHINRGHKVCANQNALNQQTALKVCNTNSIILKDSTKSMQYKLHHIKRQHQMCAIQTESHQQIAQNVWKQTASNQQTAQKGCKTKCIISTDSSKSVQNKLHHINRQQ